ncbi:MAG: hypothetical protein ACXVXJ_12795 [Mycobacteriaceae bacterium]
MTTPPSDPNRGQGEPTTPWTAADPRLSQQPTPPPPPPTGYPPYYPPTGGGYPPPPPPGGGYPPPPPPAPRPKGWVWAVIGVLATALIAVIVFFLVVYQYGDNSNNQADTTSTATATPTTTEAGRTTTGGGRTTTDPGTQTNAPGAGRCPTVYGPSGDYSHSATGTNVTTCEFAEEVRVEYGRVQPGGGPAVISVFSPVTGRTYTMSCSGANPVICTGGNNAVVYVYP